MQTQFSKKSIHRPDYQILTRIEDYDRKMKSIGVNADWFESQQKYEVKKTKNVNDKTIMRELVLTNQEIKVKRYMRLLELYNEEYNEYEKELNAKGLAVLKER